MAARESNKEVDSTEKDLTDVIRVEAAEDMLQIRDRVIAWLGQHCIYCKVTGRYFDSGKHWYRNCKKSQSMPDECEYEKLLDWQVEMDQFRKGQCYSCKRKISKCGVRDSWQITCSYGDIILPVLFLLYRRGWLKQWISAEGYHVGFGVAQLQK